MFAYMHGQVLHRYNCERLANGLGLTEEFGPPHWPQGIWPGYDSQLGSVINGNNIFLMKIFYWWEMAILDSQRYPYMTFNFGKCVSFSQLPSLFQ